MCKTITQLHYRKQMGEKYELKQQNESTYNTVKEMHKEKLCKTYFITFML